jgi:septum site-determining protein MinC
MERDTISIKGIRDGLMVTLGGGELAPLVDKLAGRLAEQGQFFQGGQVALMVGERLMGPAELEAISALLARHGMALWAVLSENEATQEAARGLQLGTRLPGSGSELAGAATMPEEGTELPAAVRSASDDEQPGVLVRGALRSGRRVESTGHVVVIGDVNPGAEIFAGGDVIVWGKLRGLVHAGAYGDQTAVVCALELVPTQLRIAELISVPPGGPRDKEPVPEMASVRDGQIVAESWSPGYRGRR